MRNVYMTPTVDESRLDLTNAIHQCVWKLSQHLPKFGYQIVTDPEQADLTAGHAGQGALEGVDVAHCHGLYPTGMVDSERWHWAANKAVIKNLTGALEITVPSRWVAQIIERDMHISPHVIGWAIDSDEWQIGEPYNYVLWNKTRADSTCDPSPMNALAQRFPEWNFISTFGVETKNVRLIGRVNHAEMRQYIEHAALYLATTKETFGIGTLEAMACGVPVLGYRWGGTADIVEHGVTGYLAEPGNLADLAQGLEYCHRYRKTLGANARIAAMGYSWERVAGQMAEVYDMASNRKFMLDHSSPLVSVVIPVHNYARYIRECVDSVMAQEASFPFEIIVVDDDSHDSPQNEIRGYIDGSSPILENAPVRYFRLETNQGVAVTRNYGIAQSRAKYIVCLDADDRLGNVNYLSTLAAALEENRELGIVYTGLAVMDERGENVTPQAWPGEYNFDEQAQRHNQIPTCCMFRKEAWRRAGGYRRRFTPAEDAHLWLSIGALGYRAAKVTSEPMFHYRMHSNSLSTPVRTGERAEPDWLALSPWAKDGKRPFASDGKPPLFSWAVRNYDQPLVSVVIPVGPGHVTLLREALDSVEGQTFRFWECIVVNDSGEPLPESLLRAYPFVKWHYIQGYKTHGGAGWARNAGIDYSTAPFVFFTDADDFLEPTCLDDMLRGYYTGAGEYIYSDWYSINKEGYIETNVTPEFNPNDVFQKTSIHAVNILIPRDYLKQVGMFDETLAAWEDVDLFMKLAQAGICGRRVPLPLFTYRYATGKRRETGEQSKGAILDILRNRYGDYIKGDKMCSCEGTSAPLATFVQSYAGFMAMADSNNENMVEILYHGAAAPVEVIGPATGQSYERRQNGEIFLVWKADADSDPGTFEIVGAKMQSGAQKAAALPPEPKVIEMTKAEWEAISTPIDSPTGETLTAAQLLSDSDITDDERAAVMEMLNTESIIGEAQTVEPPKQPAPKLKGKPGRPKTR